MHLISHSNQPSLDIEMNHVMPTPNIEGFSDELIDQFIQYAELGNQHKIVLADGRIIQGWIMEIDAEHIMVSTGYHEKDIQQHRLSFDQMLQADLFYHDADGLQWRPFYINDR